MTPFSRVAGCLLALGTTLVGTASAHATPDNLLVAPGQHLGRVFIGDSKAAVHRRLGAPQRTFKLTGGLTSELWRSKTSSDEEGALSTLEVVYRRGVVAQIEATSSTFETARGLSADAPVGDWLTAYGNTKGARYRYPNKIDQLYYDWAAKGIALEVQKGQGEGAGTREDIIHTIIVHRKGAKVVVDSGGRLVR